MILILSNYWDYSTSNLIRSFKYKNFKDFQVITTSDIINKNLKILIGGDIKVGEFKIDLKKVKVVWSRRFSSLSYTDWYESVFKERFNEYDTSAIKLGEQLRYEFSSIIQYLNYKLIDKIWYPGYNIGNINKLIVLDKAKNCGLDIPLTYIVNYKAKLKDMISKSSYEIAFFYSKIHGLLNMFTRKIDLQDNAIPAFFFPSLVQKYIDKNVELRIFFIDDNFFCMAIFSQKDKNTEVDFRNSWSFSTRWVKYQLPNDVVEKLKLLTRSAKVRTGSIDLILTPDNKYVFVELNPVGQYGMTSVPCNYNLDDFIANILIKKNEQETIYQ